MYSRETNDVLLWFRFLPCFGGDGAVRLSACFGGDGADGGSVRGSVGCGETFSAPCNFLRLAFTASLSADGTGLGTAAIGPTFSTPVTLANAENCSTARARAMSFFMDVALESFWSCFLLQLRCGVERLVDRRNVELSDACLWRFTGLRRP